MKSEDRYSKNTTREDFELFSDRIPYLKFKEDWEVKALPPFGGAIIRYQIKKGDNWCSIYLDGYDCLGCCGQPYWEVYPHNDDCFRCAIGDSESLLNAISDILD